MKMITIRLETDMWFEISDHLRIRLLAMSMDISNKQLRGDLPDPKEERKYNYLKTILECLDNQLTH